MRDAAWRMATAAWLSLLAWSVAVATAGGIDLRGLGIALVARTPWPTVVIGLALLAVVAAVRRDRLRDDLREVLDSLGARAPVLALALGMASVGVAVGFNTWAAGGSDSYCYVEQAERWASQSMLAPIAAGFEADWPNASLSLTPTGFVASRRVEGAIAPICPAGLSLLMAAPRVLGAPRGVVFCVVPVLAGLAVWAAFLVGRRLAGNGVGLATALLTASSPIFLYQSVQPMSDVPATAWWALALALAGRRSGWGLLGAGLSAGLAVAMRPNLAPLAALFVLSGWARVGEESGAPGARVLRAARVVAGLAPGALAVAVSQHVVYGSALSSGYGSLDVLFRGAHIWPNLERFPRWLLDTQSPLLLLGLLAPAVAWRRKAANMAYSVLLLAFSLGAFAAYLPYVPFEGWWFLRFWLPGIPPLIALAVSVAAVVAPRHDGPARVRAPGTGARTAPRTSSGAAAMGIAAVVGLMIGPIGLVGLTGWQLGVARDRAAFDLARLERKFIATGEYVRRSLPANAVMLTIWQSGAVRYYGERTAVLWDAIAPHDLDRVLASLEAQQREPFVALEDWERERFTSRFRGASTIADLDWPPRVRIGRAVTIWSTRDRDRFLRGEAVQSDRVWIP